MRACGVHVCATAGRAAPALMLLALWKKKDDAFAFAMMTILARGGHIQISYLASGSGQWSLSKLVVTRSETLLGPNRVRKNPIWWFLGALGKNFLGLLFSFVDPEKIG